MYVQALREHNLALWGDGEPVRALCIPLKDEEFGVSVQDLRTVLSGKLAAAVLGVLRRGAFGRTPSLSRMTPPEVWPFRRFGKYLRRALRLGRGDFSPFQERRDALRGYLPSTPERCNRGGLSA